MQKTHGKIGFLWEMVDFPQNYESQPVGLAEVIDASEASLGGPGGRAGKMPVNRVKQVVIMVFDLRVMYQVAIE